MSVIIDGTSGITSPNLDLTSGQLAVADGGTGVSTSTGTGATVRAVSPALTTPDLGTPSALVGTNISGTANNLNAGIGVNQTWQDVKTTPGRAIGTTYTNSTGRPIMVSVSASASPNGGRLEFYIDNVIVSQNGTASLASGVSYGAFQFIIPNGSTYKCVNGIGMVLTYWFELR